MKKSVKIALIGLLCLVFAVLINGCYYVFWGQEKSMKKLQNSQDLNFYECCSVYTMHMALWIFGWPLSPEAAKECFLLHFPQKDTVEFEITNAIYDSPKIEDIMVRQVREMDGEFNLFQVEQDQTASGFKKKLQAEKTAEKQTKKAKK